MRTRLVLLFVFFGVFAQAQITEINPAIGWNYVKSQELELKNELWYNTDFPAEIGFDYIFIMNHNLDSAKASLQIFDMQDGFITAKNRDTSHKIIDLPFDVKESGMYRLFFVIDGKIKATDSHKVQLMLIRRKKI